MQLCVTVDVGRELVCVTTHATVRRATLDTGVLKKVNVATNMCFNVFQVLTWPHGNFYILAEPTEHHAFRKEVYMTKMKPLLSFFILSTTGYPASYGIDIGLYKGT